MSRSPSGYGRIDIRSGDRPILALLFSLLLIPGLLPGCSPPPSAVCQAPAGSDGIARFDAHMKYEEARGFSGEVLIAQGDSIIFSGAYGEAAVDSTATSFWIASISKPITAIAALRLVEQGVLDLYAPLDTYIPDVPEAWRDISLHHLLAHRSGLPHAYAAEHIVDRSEAVNAILQLDPVHPPGVFLYSNDGYSLAAALMEVATGETFEEILQREVFNPAGMSGAGLWGFEPSPSPVAPPKDPAEVSLGKEQTSQDGWSSRPRWGQRGASGIYASVVDLYRMVRALQEGRLLQPAMVDTMLTTRNPAIGPNALTYGLGWALRLRSGRLVEYWHGGYEDWLGHNGILKVVGSRVYIILSNSGEPEFRTDVETWAQWIEEGLGQCTGEQ